MGDQVHIRNREAVTLAHALARQSGKSISDVVLEALRQYRLAMPGPASPDPVAEAWAVGAPTLVETRAWCAINLPTHSSR
jgi:hypothetical protein